MKDSLVSVSKHHESLSDSLASSSIFFS